MPIDAPPGCHALIEHARLALRRLAGVPLPVETARVAAEETEREIALYWGHTPLTAAVAGEDIGARTAFLNFLAGATLLNPSRSEPAGLVLTLRRAAKTGYRARRRNVSVEEMSLADAVLDEAVLAEGTPTPPLAALGAAADAAAGVGAAASRSALLAPAAWPVPVAAPAEAAARRSRWRRLVMWLRGLFSQRRQIAMVPAGGLLAPGLAHGGADGHEGSARDGDRTAARGTAAARATAPAAVPAAASAATGQPDSPAAALRAAMLRRFAEDVRELTDESARGAGVERVFVELAGGPLPEGVAVIDVPAVDGISRLDQVDGIVLVCDPGRPLGAAARALIRAAQATLPHVFVVATRPEAPADLPTGGPVRYVGRFAQVAAALPTLLAAERALRLGARADNALRRGLAVIDAAEEKAESGFRARLEQLEQRRIAEPGAFKAARLERLRPMVIERVHGMILQITAALAADLTALGEGWSAIVAAATTTEALRAAVARVDEESVAALATVIEEGQRVADDALAEAARELHADLVVGLHGASSGSSDKRASAPRAVAIAPSLLRDGRGINLGSAPRLASLFRSVDTLKADVLERLSQRIAALKSIAAAEPLDAEPQLTAALGEPLGGALEAAVAGHCAWLATTLAAERAAIAQERASLEPLLELRAVSREDVRHLAELMTRAESELPA